MPRYERLTTWDEVRALQVGKPADDEGPHAIYRGQVNRRWRLLPSLTRVLHDAEPDNPKDKIQVRKAVAAEAASMRVFQIAHPWKDELREWIVWWAMAQQFFGSTRSLDWSSEVGVALYFAVSGAPTLDGALFVLKQRALRPNGNPALIRVYNEAWPARGWEARREAGWKLMQQCFRSGRPRAVHVCQTIGTPARLATQSGYFTSCTNILEDHQAVIDEEDYPRDTLTKYVIPRESKRRLLEEATERGFSGGALFQDSTERAGYQQRDALVRHLGR